jgi:hypothetical protein
MLIELLQAQGYTVKEAPQGRYMKGLVPLLGGQYALGILREEYIVRLFSNAQIRKGSAYTLKQLAQIAMPDNAMPLFLTQFAQLVEHGIFIRGYRLHCPTCDLDSWYALDEVAEKVVCQGCRVPFQLPLELDFAFRPNQLLMEATKSGALTVLLTLYQWLQDAPITLWFAALEVSKDGHSTDIDLLAQREDGLYMAECKDNFKLNEVDALQERLRYSKAIADSMSAKFVFATLMEAEIPAALRDFCDAQGILIQSRSTLLQYKENPH